MSGKYEDYNCPFCNSVMAIGQNKSYRYADGGIYRYRECPLCRVELFSFYDQATAEETVIEVHSAPQVSEALVAQMRRAMFNEAIVEARDFGFFADALDKAKQVRMLKALV